MKTQAVFLRVLYRSTNPNQPKHDPDQVGTSTIVGTPAINSVRHSSNFFCQFVSMSIQPVAIVDLDHRAYKICGIGNPFGLIAVSPSGQFTLINDRFEHLPALLPANIGSARSLEIDSAIKSIAVVHDLIITVANLEDGTIKSQFEAPELDSSATDRFSGGFDSCHFDMDNALWCVAGTSESSITVQLRDPDSGKLTDQIRLNDPFGSSFSSFSRTPDRETVALWITAGQDGQIINWLYKRNGISVEVEKQLIETTPPEFSVSDKEFLVSDYFSVGKFSFPDVAELGRCSCESLGDDGFGTSLAWIDDHTGLVVTHQCRLFQIDLESMSLAKEIILEFPEGVTKDEWGFSWFQRIGEFLIFVCRREKQPVWKDSLVIYRANDFQTG